MQPERPSFLYDADCGPCSRFKEVISFFDASHAVGFLPIEDAGRQGLLASVPRSSWYSSARMVAKDGTAKAGGEALLSLLRLLPGGWLPSEALSSLPHGRSSANWLYSILARTHSTSCAANALKPPREGAR